MRFLSVITACLIFTSIPTFSQSKDYTFIDNYKVNHVLEIPLSLAGLILSSATYPSLHERASFTEEDIAKLSADEIASAEKYVLRFPKEEYENARVVSDLVMQTAILTPAFLFIDKNARRNWLDIISLYTEAHLASMLIQQSATYLVRKPRPLVYNENLPMEERTGINTSNSFFSGHTSTTAVSCFFFAKIYSDHHKLKKWQKTLLFAGAAVPPAIVGYYRIKGGKHFRSDVLTGLAVGAATGILIPELHKKKPKNLSIIPVQSKECRGLALNFTF